MERHLLEELAESRYRKGAKSVEAVIVSDGGHGLPGVFERDFPGIPRIHGA